MGSSKIRNRKTKHDKSGNILFVAYLINAIEAEFKVRVKNSEGIREKMNCLVSLMRFILVVKVFVLVYLCCLWPMQNYQDYKAE